MNTIKTKLNLIVVSLVLLIAAPMANAFYMAEAGRWINRDPIGERGGDNLYQMIGNRVTMHADKFGLFGRGFSSGGRHWGHGDMPGSGYFDYNEEDNDPNTRPYPMPWPFPPGAPGNHFLDPATTAQDLDNAIGACNSHLFSRAMHRRQDTYSHYNQNFRWDPLDLNAKGLGLGHLLSWPSPDNNESAFWDAFDDAQKWMTKWHQNCCQDACGLWTTRASGACSQ